jgi:hypothetical protein
MFPGHLDFGEIEQGKQVDRIVYVQGSAALLKSLPTYLSATVGCDEDVKVSVDAKPNNRITVGSLIVKLNCPLLFDKTHPTNLRIRLVGDGGNTLYVLPITVQVIE